MVGVDVCDEVVQLTLGVPGNINDRCYASVQTLGPTAPGLTGGSSVYERTYRRVVRQAAESWAEKTVCAERCTTERGRRL